MSKTIEDVRDAYAAIALTLFPTLDLDGFSDALEGILAEDIRDAVKASEDWRVILASMRALETIQAAGQNKIKNPRWEMRRACTVVVQCCDDHAVSTT